MSLRHRRALPIVGGLALACAALVGCGSSGENQGLPIIPSPTASHDDLVLRDRWGDPLQVTSTEPYSPRRTCGECHDIDTIANGYHFQQGRTDAAGNLQMHDDFNGDGQSWLLSDGMFGKW
jgi:hypothetical protein